MNNTGWSPFGWGTLPRRSGGAAIPTANLQVFLDGDDTDGSSNSTRTNGAAFNNWLNKGALGGTFSNATGTQQPLFASSLLAGHAGATFDGTDDRLVSSLAASSFTFMHDGSGASVYVVARSPNAVAMTILSTRAPPVTSRGLMVGTSTLYRARVTVSDGTNDVAVITSAASSISNGLFDVISARLAAAATPNLRVDVNSASVGTSAASAFSGAGPAGTLHLASNTVPAVPYGGDILCVLVYDVDHDDATEASIKAILDAKYGVVFPA